MAQKSVVGVNVTVKGLEDVVELFSEKRFEVKTRRAMRASLTVLRDKARILSPEDTGTAKRTMRANITGTGINMIGIVASPEKYFYNIEFGRQVGAAMPPERPIALWASRHGIQGRGAVYLIRRAIQRRGIRALHVMQKALDSSLVEIDRIFTKEFDGYPN